MRACIAAGLGNGLQWRKSEAQIRPVQQRWTMLNPVRIAQSLADLCFSSRYKVEGDSMLPSLAHRQYLLLAPCRFSWNRIHRGDIVVLRHPDRPKEVYVKRVVGLPNEDLHIDGGVVYLNENPLEEAYLADTKAGAAGSIQAWWTGPDEYVVLGDNRAASTDSRTFGTVGRRHIIGRVWFRFWPPEAWGRLAGPT